MANMRELVPFMLFEVLLMAILVVCVYAFKTDARAFIFSTRWPPRCTTDFIPGETTCKASGETVKIVDFGESSLLITLGVLKIVATLTEILFSNSKSGDVITMVQNVLTLGFALSYVTYILGVNEIMVLFLFVIYSFTMSTMVNIHDELFRLGKGSRNLRAFFYSIDAYIFASSLVVFMRYSLSLYDSGGDIEVYPIVVLLASLVYVVGARSIRFQSYYRKFPSEAIRILGVNGIESDMDDIFDRPIYPIVSTANPDMVLTFHFYTRLIDISLLTFLMLCYITQLNRYADGYNI